MSSKSIQETSASALPFTDQEKPGVKPSLFSRLRHWHTSVWPGANIPVVFGIIILGLILWWLVPPGLGSNTWQLFVLFVCTIIAAILEPVPLSGVCLISLGIVSVTGVLTTSEMLSGFSSSAVWLVMFAFFFASGFVVTGLGKRMCFLVLRYAGSTTLGLGYGICLCEFLLAMAIPSNTARGVGVMMPILLPLMKDAFQSDPELGTSARIGTYLVLVEITANAMGATCWLTGNASNALMLQFLKEVGVDLNWTSWAYSQAPVTLVSLILMPLVMLFLTKPEIRKTPEAPQIAKMRLEEMGPLSIREWTMLSCFLGVLILWILSSTVPSIFPFTTTGVAAMGVGVLLLLGIISVKDHIICNKGAFDLLLWFSILLMFASELKKKGFFEWLAVRIDFSSLPPYACLLLVCVIFYITQYAFASITAHVSALYLAIILVAEAAGTNAQVACRAVAWTTMCGHLTPYTSSANPAYFALGYVSTMQWWVVGAIILAMNLVNLATIGFGYWWLLGYW